MIMLYGKYFKLHESFMREEDMDITKYLYILCGDY